MLVLKTYAHKTHVHEFTFQILPVAPTTVETSSLEAIILDKQIWSLGKYTAIILNAS